MVYRFITGVFTASFLTITCLNGGISNKNIAAARTSGSLKIDGFLSESDWSVAVPVSGFQQFDPEEGAPSTESTSVKILYDNTAIYIGVVCYDSDPPAIRKQLSRRDRTTNTDRFAVMIDSYHDHNTAFLFSGSVAGVQSDGILSQDGLIYDIQWDAVWEFAAKILNDGWSAEFKIPYSALRFSKQEGEYYWGINFRRYIARKKETDEWVMVPRKMVPPGTLSSVSLMGNLSGIFDINPALHIELLPYHVSKINMLSQPYPFQRKDEYKYNMGLDIKYGLSNNFIFDMAINPDFGQVEVDKAVLNLTVFETQYPEKRPFFLEGSQIFSFGNCIDNTQMPLLYSRRIGREPSGYDSLKRFKDFVLDSNATFSQKPEATTILTAAKISGHTNSGLDIGFLSALTDKEEAVLKDTKDNLSPPITVEPRAAYNALRLRQKIWENSAVGLMATGAFKQNTLPSYSGGIDWNLRFLESMYGIDGYLAASSQNRFSGSSGRLGMGKIQGEHWIIFSAYEFFTKQFSIDDLGYFSQPREHGGYTQISYKEDDAASPARRYAVTTTAEYRRNWNGINTMRQLRFEPSWEFRNFWKLTFDYIHEFPAYDDENKLRYGTKTSKNMLYRRPWGNDFSATLRTDDRQPVDVTLSAGYSYFSRGADIFLTTLQSSVRPLSWIEFIPSMTYMKTRKEETWIIGYFTNDYNLFGDRDIEQYDLSLQCMITFTPNMSLQFFNQILTAEWRYTSFKALISPDYLPLLSPQPSDLDQFYKVFNANIVFRWEYMPGSTFYFVWTQARNGFNGTYNQNFLKEVYDVFRIPTDNVFLAKITYWWSI